MDRTNQFNNFFCWSGERMDHAARTANSFAAILPEALFTQDFDKICMGCP
jgi:hypothetical protein